MSTPNRFQSARSFDPNDPPKKGEWVRLTGAPVASVRPSSLPAQVWVALALAAGLMLGLAFIVRATFGGHPKPGPAVVAPRNEPAPTGQTPVTPTVKPETESRVNVDPTQPQPLRPKAHLHRRRRPIPPADADDEPDPPKIKHKTARTHKASTTRHKDAGAKKHHKKRASAGSRTTEQSGTPSSSSSSNNHGRA
jgi:cytoskeletal protein RodZ